MSALVKTCTRALPVDAARLDQRVLGLAAIGAAVHAQRAADRAGNAAEEGEPGDRRLLRGAATFTSGTAVPARMRLPSSTLTSLKPRPSRITTPGTPPSRTIRLEPSPMTVTGISAGRLAQEIGEVGLVLRHEQNLRRPADAEPGQLRERLVGQQPPAQVAACLRFEQSGTMSGARAIAGHAHAHLPRAPRARPAARRPIA